jgi:peptidoglycan lytic transglycosylase
VEPFPRLAPAVIALALATAACAQPRRESATAAPTPAPVVVARPAPAAPRVVQTGAASWYGQAHHGKKTASGEAFDMYALTAAHRSLPLGTRIRVTNVANGRAIDVRINDRGPAIPGRIIDLSYGAARALGAVGDGVLRVRIAILE